MVAIYDIWRIGSMRLSLPAALSRTHRPQHHIPTIDSPPETSMQQKGKLGRLATRASIAIGLVLAATVPLTMAGESQAATNEALSVDLASSRGTSTLVGEGVLYGINQDATLPAD